jgi:hypothetical protein
MKKLRLSGSLLSVRLLPTCALVGLVLVACGSAASADLGASSAGSASRSVSGVKVVHLHDPLQALAMDGGRVAYDVSSDLSKLPNRVLVWNLARGTTTKVSGRQTGGAESVTGGGVRQLAIAGTRVAWLISYASNEEAGDDIYTSSLASPKERHVLHELRSGNQCGAGQAGYQPACAGTWLGGVVGSGNRILVNRWTTDLSGTVTDAGLYALEGTKLKPVASGPEYVEAAAADSKRVAVVQWQWLPGNRTIHVYSASGGSPVTLTVSKQPESVALSGRNLVVLTHNGKLFLYDARTGALRNVFTPHAPNQQVLAVEGNIAVYSSRGTIRALNLSNGKDRPVGRLPGQIILARIDSTGLVYTNNEWTPRHGYTVQLVFVPFKRVAAIVS